MIRGTGMTDRPNEPALAAFLRTPVTDRRPEAYERVFDDFVRYAGGGRVADRFEIPAQVRNADYHFDLEDFEILLELKQINKYGAARTADAYFSKLIEQGRVLRLRPLSDGQARIDPESLPPNEWRKFYKSFRPSITDHLDKASRQLKQTDRLLRAEGGKPRFCGVMLINSGDYNLPLDLMYRLVEWRTKNMWKSGRYSKLDFVSCLTIDMIREGQHPLQGRHIGRTADATLTRAVHYIYDRWLFYCADAIGMELEFRPHETMADPPLQLSGQFQGKIRRVGEPEGRA